MNNPLEKAIRRLSLTVFLVLAMLVCGCGAKEKVDISHAPTAAEPPEATAAEPPEATAAESPEATTAEPPEATTSEPPEATTAEPPEAATPESPGAAAAETPEAATPESPGAAAAEPPEATTPVTPDPETPESPGAAASETPEAATPESPDPAPSESPDPALTAAPAAQFEVHFIDVGQGDAILVLCDGHAMLVDGGKSSQSDRIYTYLRKNGVDHLDYMVATHPDADHIGGLAGALNYASVDVVLSSVRDDETETFKNFVKYAGRQGLSITVPDAGDVLELGSATVSVLGPTGPAEDDNNQSIVLKVVHGSNSVLLTGDAETEEEQKIMQSGADLSSTVLKIAHHGSKYSTSKAWLSAVQPDIAVISCGGDNEYGHPAEQVLNQLKDMDVTVLRTDLQGDIILCEENGRLSWSVDRGEDADVFVPGILPAAEDTAVKDENTVENTTEKTAENIVEKTAENAAENAKTYILNTHTGKFHYPDCRSVKKMKEANKREFTGSRDEIIAMGYDPCGNCHP